jgi:hypothetical protein
VKVRALNCIHAISDVDRELAPLRTWTSYGEEAARRVVVHLGRWVKDPGKDHPDAWKSIWEATWRDVPAPVRLDVVRGESPWKYQAAPSWAAGEVSRSGFAAREGSGTQPDRPEDSSAAGGG